MQSKTIRNVSIVLSILWGLSYGDNPNGLEAQQPVPVPNFGECYDYQNFYGSQILISEELYPERPTVRLELLNGEDIMQYPLVQLPLGDIQDNGLYILVTNLRGINNNNYDDPNTANDEAIAINPHFFNKYGIQGDSLIRFLRFIEMYTSHINTKSRGYSTIPRAAEILRELKVYYGAEFPILLADFVKNAPKDFKIFEIPEETYTFYSFILDIAAYDTSLKYLTSALSESNVSIFGISAHINFKNTFKDLSDFLFSQANLKPLATDYLKLNFTIIPFEAFFKSGLFDTRNLISDSIGGLKRDGLIILDIKYNQNLGRYTRRSRHLHEVLHGLDSYFESLNQDWLLPNGTTTTDYRYAFMSNLLFTYEDSHASEFIKKIIGNITYDTEAYAIITDYKGLYAKQIYYPDLKDGRTFEDFESLTDYLNVWGTIGIIPGMPERVRIQYTDLDLYYPHLLTNSASSLAGDVSAFHESFAALINALFQNCVSGKQVPEGLRQFVDAIYDINWKSDLDLTQQIYPNY